jgi:uncharacterized membrane protein YhaH (DUF805 family)
MNELSPIGWALRPLKRFADFSGRSPRAEYWWWVLAVVVIGLFLGAVDAWQLGGPVVGGYGPLGLMFMLAIMIPGLAVTVRRLHDTDRSGWWAVLKAGGYAFGLSGTSFAGSQLTSLGSGLLALAVVLILGWLCVAVLVFVFLATGGTGGPNRYGPDPYVPDQLEEVFA